MCPVRLDVCTTVAGYSRWAVMTFALLQYANPDVPYTIIQSYCTLHRRFVGDHGEPGCAVSGREEAV